MRSSDVFKYREQWEGFFGALPSEIAPRLLIIGDFPAGRAGLNAPPPGAGNSIHDVLREYSVGKADYNLDYAKVFARQSYQGSQPAGFDLYNVTASDATEAVTPALTDGDAVPVDLFHFEAIGPGTAYNGLQIQVEVSRVIASGHPAGSNIAVCTVTIPSPNPYANDEIFENIVFTYEGSTDGNSGAHRTRDASIINDPVVGSRVVRLVYEATANTSNFGVGHVKGDVETADLASGTAGTALADLDWTTAIQAVEGLPFRWFVIANPPSDPVRQQLHTSAKVAPFGLGILNQMYGETITDFITARDTYGSEADDGKSMPFFGWGSHFAAQDREVPFGAAYMGRWSAKIASVGLGGGYAVGNTGLGFKSIASGDELTKTQMDLAAAAGINYATRLYDGSFGVHGYWTLDDQVDRMGDGSVRVIFNDIVRRLAIAFTPLAQNRPNSPLTRQKIQRLGDQAVLPYLNLKYVERAASGTYDLMQVRDRWPGVTFPDLPGWVVYMLSIKANLTLGGIFAHLTDAEVEGLTAIAGGPATGGNVATGGNA